jgi:Zn-dependent peptidase ImmA (M78 family)
MLYEEVCAAAHSLLRAAGLTTLPIDVHAAAHHYGIEIRPLHLPDSTSGFLYPGLDWPVIVVNARHPRTRQRFTIAHEIWHWRTGDGALALHLESGTHTLLEEERAANAFAAALLMPEDLLRREVSLNPDRRALAWRFGVSPRALARRLSELSEA